MTSFADIDGFVVPPTLAEMGFHTPTAVQVEGIAPILEEQHVVLHSGTGTGKTLAYLLPALQRLEHDATLRSVVFSPGTELAMQTLRVAKSVAPELHAAVAASTTNRKRQKKRITQSTRLILGTPDRLIPLFQAKKLKRVGLIVFDELDPILANPHSAFLETLLSRSEPKVQIVVASATLGRRSEAFIDRFMPDVVRVEPDGARPEVGLLTHRLVKVPRNTGRDVTLARFVEQNKIRRAIVFASGPRVQSHLARYLADHDLDPVTVTREGSKTRRQAGLKAFRQGSARLLLTTDAIARGLDLPDVDWVLHYDLPRAFQAYVHRAGRTARAGRPGTSVVFAEQRDLGTIRRLERSLGLRFAR